MIKPVTAYIGVGSNLTQPKEQIESARRALSAYSNIEYVQSARLYGSHAVGPGSQPDYVNTVFELRTRLNAHDLLKALQSIEHAQGRVRTLRWGARTLDLDLLWYNGDNINTDDLIVPHPRISERNFVLFPFQDIAPSVLVDGQRRVADLATRLSHEGIWVL